MEKITTQDSDAIINKGRNAIAAPINDEEINSSIERLSSSFKKTEYTESGLEEMEVNGGRLELKYSMVEGHLIEDLESYIKIQTHSMKIGNDSPAADVSNWRRVIRLRYSKNDKTYDLLKSFPNNYNIFFCPTEKEIGGAVYKSKNIYVLGDVASPRGLVTVLHEIGHMWDNLKLEVAGKDNFVDDHKYSVQAEKLRSERAANAYALASVRRFLKDETERKDVINFLKNYALMSYNKNVTKEISNQELAESFFSEWGLDSLSQKEKPDELDYFLVAFKKWKLTLKYLELKDQFILEAESEDEEFSNWLEWLEKTGYEFWKDFSDYDLATEGQTEE